MPLNESYVLKDADGTATDYVFLDATRMQHYPRPNRFGFLFTVGFSVDTGIHGLGMEYPVVFDDYTTSSGNTLHPVSFAEVPPAIKRKLTRWLKYQPPEDRLIDFPAELPTPAP